MNREDIDLNALAGADEVIVHVSHSSFYVDTSEPLVGTPKEVNDRGELAVTTKTGAFFVKFYEHDDETVLATKAQSTKTRPRNRGTCYTVDSIETR